MNKLNTNKSSQKTKSIYLPAIISRTVSISIRFIGDNIKETLEKEIIFNIEGKCIVEGYVKPGSVRIKSYSSGNISGAYVDFVTVVECLICNPVEGMLIDCIAKNITESSGIRAETNDQPSPVVIYIARDHYYKDNLFKNVKVNQSLKVRVIGQRFELNDTYISIIAEIVDVKKKKLVEKKKLVIEE
jgi:hypothetical protein